MIEPGRLITAMVTPFTSDGAVDYAQARRLAVALVDSGSESVVVSGTTGEAPTLKPDEKLRLFREVKEALGDRAAVIAGSGDNCTEDSIELSLEAKRTGVDALLLTVPYYNKPSQEGLYQHFKAVAEAADIPIVVYNIPGRSVVDITVDTMARLAKIPNIVGVKDATCDLARPLRTRITAGKEFCQLSGEDITVASFLAQGGEGCISVTSNVAPKLCAELHAAWRERDLDTFYRIRDRLAPLHDAMFCEPSPAPAKYGASLLGKSAPDVRLPLVNLTAAGQARVRDAMVHCGLIN